MLIIGLAALVVLVVVAIHSNSRKDVPREGFYIDIDQDEE